MKTISKKRALVLNLAFGIAGIGIVLFLLMAPEETTSKLPMNEIHQEFHEIKSKKEAEKRCTECHSPDGSAPLPADHPSKYRCLFCHKR